MRMRWKLVGLAGVAGVAATGAVLARKPRAQHDYQPEVVRDRLHRRLAEVSRDRPEPASPSDESVAPAPDERQA